MRIDWRWSWCIFQLPLTIGRRCTGPAPPAFATLGTCRVGALGAWRSASRPGRSPCSRSSREAPPPVDTKPTWDARSSSSSAATESPPPTTVKARESATALATVRVPAAKRSSSNTPIGPFQNTVPAPATASAKAPAVSGPMSTPRHPRGTSVPIIFTSPLPALCCPTEPPGPRATMSVGSRIRSAGLLEEPGAAVDAARIEQRGADGVAPGGQEGERHALPPRPGGRPAPAGPAAPRACRPPWHRPRAPRRGGPGPPAAPRGPRPHGPGGAPPPTAGVSGAPRSRRGSDARHRRRRSHRRRTPPRAGRRRRGRSPPPRVETEVLEQPHPGGELGQTVPDRGDVEAGVDGALGPARGGCRR